jgi:selT/selW/selH-like putative selenoprotein
VTGEEYPVSDEKRLYSTICMIV